MLFWCILSTNQWCSFLFFSKNFLFFLRWCLYFPLAGLKTTGSTDHPTLTTLTAGIEYKYMHDFFLIYLLIYLLYWHQTQSCICRAHTYTAKVNPWLLFYLFFTHFSTFLIYLWEFFYVRLVITDFVFQGRVVLHSPAWSRTWDFPPSLSLSFRITDVCYYS